LPQNKASLLSGEEMAPTFSESSPTPPSDSPATNISTESSSLVETTLTM